MTKSPKTINCKICLNQNILPSHSHLTPKFLTNKTRHLVIHKNNGDKIYQFLAPSWLELHIKVSSGQNLFFSLRRNDFIIIGDLNKDLTKHTDQLIASSKQTYHQKP